MKKYCVVVADSARARIYSLQIRETPDGSGRPYLHSERDMVNPGRRARDAEVFTNSRPGTRRGAPGGPGHGVDDHRNEHSAELERRFANDIVDEIKRVASSGSCTNLVLAAAPRMLGALRSPACKLQRAFDVAELDRDLTKLTPTDVHDHLAAKELIPPRSRSVEVPR